MLNTADMGLFEAGGLSIANIVSVLGREEGYTANYGLSPREFLRAQPEGTPEGSGHILPYILSRVLIRTLYHF